MVNAMWSKVSSNFLCGDSHLNIMINTLQIFEVAAGIKFDSQDDTAARTGISLN